MEIPELSEFVQKIIDDIPELIPIYDEHVSYYEVLLSHVLFGDFSRFILEKLERPEDNETTIRCFMSHMSQGFYLDDEYISNLVHVSFIENLTGEYAAVDKLMAFSEKGFVDKIKEIIGYDQR